jgi:N-acetylmuramoyl-L-alanine amidase
MEIKNHRLVDGDQRETPNCGGIIEPKYLVFHFTAGSSAEGSVEWLCNPDATASAHIVVGRDGKITQLAPFNVKT